MYQQVIVRTPSPSLIYGLTASIDSGPPNYKIGLQQHQNYIEALISCQVEVTILPAVEEFPDSCFVEDTALLTEKIAVLTRSAATSRQGEVKLIEPIIQTFYKKRIERIKSPGTLEAGDVLRIENHFYIGLTKRTNMEGAKQLSAILEEYGYGCTIIEVKKCHYLKKEISYLGNGYLLVTGEFINNTEFQQFNRIIIDDHEAYGANCIRVNDSVIVLQSCKNTIKQIKDLDLQVIPIEMDEFIKIDGGLSSLSLRF